MAKRVLIIGAGHAGTNVAENLIRNDWSGEILFLTSEDYLPYDRPPLSKGILTDEKSKDDLHLTSGDFFEKENVHIQTGTQVEQIFPDAKQVRTADGRMFDYDFLVIATGSGANVPDVPGITKKGVFTLRTLSQALELKEHLSHSRKIAIIGGGLIGMEVAAATRSLGIETTVIHRSAEPLSRLMPKTITSKLLNTHREHGTNIHLDTQVKQIVGNGSVTGVALDRGELIEADTVLIAAGAYPETCLAELSGLNVNNGVVVNSKLQTSDPFIYAAGDVARFPNGSGHDRLESWKNAVDQGATVASNIMGQDTDYKAIPWMWTDQFDKVVQVAGRHDSEQREVIRELPNGGLVSFHLSDDGTLKAAMAFGDISQVSKSIRPATSMIEKGLRPDPALLEDETVDLRKLLKLLTAELNKASESQTLNSNLVAQQL